MTTRRKRWAIGRPRVVAAVAFAACALQLPADHLVAQSRDVPTQAQVGTGLLAGRLVDDRAEPVRRGTVRLDLGGTAFRTIVTGADAGFTFTELPPGSFTLSASKPGYVSTQYGSSRPGRPGTSLVLGGGARIDNIVLTLARGAVITGRITNQRGEPVPGLQVRLLRSRFAPGGRAFVPVSTTPMSPMGSLTDDRGVYRFYGLEPGDYVVGTVPPALRGGGARVMTQADLDRAALEGQRGRGRAGLAGARGAIAPWPDTPPVAYVPVYYPGVISFDAATTIALRSGEERSSVDFAIDLVPTVKVSGVVTRADGPLPAVARVALMPNSAGIAFLTMRTGPVAADGTFELPHVVPGDYIAAVTGTTSVFVLSGDGVTRTVSFAMPGNAAPSTSLTAVLPVSIGSGGLSGLTLHLTAGVSLACRLEFEGTSAPVASPADFTVSLSPRADVNQAGRPARGTVNASGEIVATGVLPGRYNVTVARVASPSSPASANWSASSMIVNGRDVLDHGLDVTGTVSSLSAVVTLTDRPASLAGVFQNASGQPAADFTVVLFSADRAMWRWQSRRIRAMRPSSDGRYGFSDVAPGDYLLTAVTDIEPNEWFDPQYLDTVVSSALKLSIAVGERKVQDIRTR